MQYVPTIGLEVHAELKTKSKMFCGCKNDPHDAEANAHTCPVCLAHPGTLPVPNQAAIEKVILFGKAIGATIATYSEFDRKNYFYPDIPKAYQISQYAYPFLTGGEIAGVKLTRVHLEEDTARSQHDQGSGSLVDFNRAGVPLMELVTEPVIHDAATAERFAKELQLILRTLDISDANMERGEMRVEANISISKTAELGTKVEVKNLNSFRSVVGAIEYEIARHQEVLETGGVLQQETRGWDEVKLKTFTQRSKETAKDYRYFPDPDLPKMEMTSHAARVGEIMPQLPQQKREKYGNLGLPSDQVEIVIAHRELDRVFAEVVQLIQEKPAPLKLAMNYLTSDILSLVGQGTVSFSTLDTTKLTELITMLSERRINSRIAKDLLPELFVEGPSIAAVAEARGLLQVEDESALKEIVATVIANNPGPAEEFKAGKVATLQFLVGQGMKLSRGTANPAKLTELFTAELTK
jgi:aspartyl-tRNA(Asn)/glutamyl-tRNA(Gln) amidotransferase subunit B